jgi:hypothetical protein
MRHPFNLIYCNHPNNTGWGQQIIKFNIIYLPPSSCYLLSHKANSFLSNLFSNPPSTSCHQYHSPRFTPIWINRQSYSSVYFNLHIFIYQMGRQKRPPDIQGSCEYTEWTKNSSSVGVGERLTTLGLKRKHVTKNYTGPWAWIYIKYTKYTLREYVHVLSAQAL